MGMTARLLTHSLCPHQVESFRKKGGKGHPPANGGQHLGVCHTVVIAEVPDHSIHELQWEVLDHTSQGAGRRLLLWKGVEFSCHLYLGEATSTPPQHQTHWNTFIQQPFPGLHSDTTRKH